MFTLIHSIEAHNQHVYGLKISHDNTKLISGSSDGFVKVWSLENFKELACISTEVAVGFLDIDANSAIWAVACWNGKIKFLNLENFKNVLQAEASSREFNILFFDKSSKFVVSGSSDGCVRVFDIEAKSFVHEINMFSMSIYALHISHTNNQRKSLKYIAVGAQSIHIWNFQKK